MFWHIVNGVLNFRSLIVGGANVGGVLTTNTTQAGTTAVTTEEDLWTYSLPANTLNADGKTVRVTAYGTVAANGNTKNIRIYFGVNLLTTTSTASGSSWRAVYEITRTGAATQVGVASRLIGTGGDVLVSAPTQDTTGAITIKVTGQNGSANANDIVFRGAIVEVLN